MNSLPIKLIVIFGSAFICSAVILLGIYPYRPNSLSGWAVLYLASLPIVFLFEVLGDKLLDNKATRKLRSSGGRVLYGVVALGLVFVASIFIVSWLEPYLGKWGS